MSYAMFCEKHGPRYESPCSECGAFHSDPVGDDTHDAIPANEFREKAHPARWRGEEYAWVRVREAEEEVRRAVIAAIHMTSLPVTPPDRNDLAEVLRGCITQAIEMGTDEIAPRLTLEEAQAIIVALTHAQRAVP